MNTTRIFKQIFLITVFLLAFGSLFAQQSKPDGYPPPPPPRYKGDIKNYRGKRMAEDEKDFYADFIKITEIPDGIFLEIFFTQTIDVSAFSDDSILINDKPVSLDGLHFSKTCRGFRIFLDSDVIQVKDAEFSVKIQNMISINGKTLIPGVLENCKAGNEYRYIAGEKIWKKFL